MADAKCHTDETGMHCLTHQEPIIDEGGCRIAREASQKEAADRQRAVKHGWTIPFGDVDARITIDRVGGIQIWFERDGEHVAAFDLDRNACEFGLALLDASREAAQVRVKLAERAERKRG